MMKAELFDTLVQLNLSASIAILFVLLVRSAFRRRFGPRGAYCLWLIVIVALVAVILPARRELGTIPSPQHTIVDKIEGAAAAARIDSAVLPLEADYPLSNSIGSETVLRSPGPDPVDAFLSIWIFGAFVAAFVTLARQRRYLKSIGDLQREHINGQTVWRSSKPGIGPALVGAIRSRIILPHDFEQMFSARERSLVLDHERMHAEAGDARVNGLVSLMACLLWFNPLIHIAARFVREDQELACDASVISRHPNSRRIYGEMLLKVLTRRQVIPAGCTWSSRTKSGLAQRISSLVSARQNAHQHMRGIIVVSVLCAGFGAAAWASQTPVRIVRAYPASIDGGAMTAAQLIDPSGASPVAAAQGPGAALSASERHIVTGVDLENIAAILTVVAEDRNDTIVSVTNSKKLPAPAISVENGRLLVNGDLALREQQCAERYDGKGAVDLPGFGATRRGDLPEIIIRMPRQIDLTVHGVVLVEVGASAGGRIESNSCGDMHIGSSSGLMDVVLTSYGDIDVEPIHAKLRARLFGLGDMQIAGALHADLDLRGEGSITAGRFSDGVKARLQGIGDIKIASVAGKTELALPGGGDIAVNSLNGPVNAIITGSGSIIIDRAISPDAELQITGAGAITIGEGNIDALRTILSGGGGVHFGGTADIVNSEFEFSDAGVYVENAGEVHSRRKGRSTGKVTIGR